MGISRCQSLPNVRDLISAQLDQQPDYERKPAENPSDNEAIEVHGATVHAGQRFMEMMAAMQMPLSRAEAAQEPSSDELWDWSTPRHVLPSEEDEMWDWSWGCSEYEECEMQEEEDEEISCSSTSTMLNPSDNLKEIVWYWQTYHATAEPRSAVERHEDEMWTWGSTFPVDEFDKWGQPRKPCAHSQHGQTLSHFVHDQYDVHSLLTC